MTTNTIFDEIMKDSNLVLSTKVNENEMVTSTTSKSKPKHKEQSPKSKEKELLYKRNKYNEDKIKLHNLKTVLEKALHNIPDADLVTMSKKKIIISKSKLYKLEFRIVRK